MLNKKLLVLVWIGLLSFILACSTSPLAPSSQESLNNNSKSSNSSQDVARVSNLTHGLLKDLIGQWVVQDWQLQNDGSWKEQAGASWTFYTIQGDTALRDEWQSNVPDKTQLPGYATQIRVFEPLSKTWQSVWLSSRTRQLDLYRGQETEDGVVFTSVVNSGQRITRTTFSDIQEASFSWELAWSNDNGQTWLSVYKVKAMRSK